MRGWLKKCMGKKKEKKFFSRLPPLTCRLCLRHTVLLAIISQFMRCPFVSSSFTLKPQDTIKFESPLLITDTTPHKPLLLPGACCGQGQPSSICLMKAEPIFPPVAQSEASDDNDGPVVKGCEESLGAQRID